MANTIIEATGVAELTRMGWNYERLLERKPHLPANFVDFQDAVVLQIIATQAGTADDTNVRASFDNATPEAAIATVLAL